jgi:hypothetical protein
MNRTVILLLWLFLRAWSSAQVTPLVDYHQHLFSPAKAAIVYEPTLPEITLPKELDSLIRGREQVQNDVVALRMLYTTDSLMLNTQDEDNPSWVRGNDAIAKKSQLILTPHTASRQWPSESTEQSLLSRVTTRNANPPITSPTVSFPYESTTRFGALPLKFPASPGHRDETRVRLIS